MPPGIEPLPGQTIPTTPEGMQFLPQPSVPDAQPLPTLRPWWQFFQRPVTWVWIFLWLALASWLWTIAQAIQGFPGFLWILFGFPSFWWYWYWLWKPFWILGQPRPVGGGIGGGTGGSGGGIGGGVIDGGGIGGGGTGGGVVGGDSTVGGGGTGGGLGDGLSGGGTTSDGAGDSGGTDVGAQGGGPAPEPFPQPKPSPTPEPSPAPQPMPTPEPGPWPAPQPGPGPIAGAQPTIPSGPFPNPVSTIEENIGRFVARFPSRVSRIATESVTRGELPIPALSGQRAAEAPALTQIMMSSANPRRLTGFSALGILATHRYRSKWGRVIDAKDGLPLQGVVVTLLDAQGKPRQNIRTKPDGHFVFLVPPGQYLLATTRAGYAMETQPKSPAIFPDELLYTGAPFTVQPSPDGRETLTPPVVVTMKSTKKVARRVSLRPVVQRMSNSARMLHAQVALPLLLTSAGFNTMMLVLQPTPFLVASEILYGVLLSIELLLSRVFRRAIGRLRDTMTRNPVALAILRLMDERTGRIVNTYVSTAGGSFLFLSRPGPYRLAAAHPKYQPHEEHVAVRGGSPGLGRVTVRLQPRSGAPRAL